MELHLPRGRVWELPVDLCSRQSTSAWRPGITSCGSVWPDWGPCLIEERSEESSTLRRLSPPFWMDQLQIQSAPGLKDLHPLPTCCATETRETKWRRFLIWERSPQVSCVREACWLALQAFSVQPRTEALPPAFRADDSEIVPPSATGVSWHIS